MRNGLYVFKEDNLSQKDLYLKRQLVGFIKELGYPEKLLLNMKLYGSLYNDLSKPAC